MTDLLDNIYLPELKKKNLLNSETYRFLKENGEDPTILEGYEKNHEDIKFPVIENASDMENFLNEQSTSIASTGKEYLETFGNFLTDETEDLITSLSLAFVNGADVAVNLQPLIYKMFSHTPLALTLPKEFFNPKTEEDVYNLSKHILAGSLGRIFRNSSFRRMPCFMWYLPNMR